MESPVRSLPLAALFLLAGSLSFAPICEAVTVTLLPSKDNTLIETPNGNSNGAGDGIYVGRVGTLGGGSMRRGVMAFNLSSIPVNSTINSVTLTLQMSQSVNSISATVTLHRLNADWGEGTAFGAGTGAPAGTGDATWTYRFFATDAWSSAGGDFVAQPSASQTVTDLAAYEWTGPGLVADVQSWVNTPTSNFGWLVFGNEATLQAVKKFDSREGSQPPALTVDYTPPSTGVGSHSVAGVEFAPPWPSPASGPVHLGYTLARPAKVSLAIHDVMGHVVRRLVAGATQSAGSHGLVWDGRTDSGERAPSGLYLARLVVGQDQLHRRIPLVH